jgi:hypothetical protein
MLKAILLLSLLCYTYAAQQDTWIAVDGQPGDFRALDIQKDAVTQSITIAGVSYKRLPSGEVDYESKLDAAAFKAQLGSKNHDLAWYYGSAQATFTGDWQNGGKDFMATVDATLGEVIVGVQSIAVYEDHDGQAGFQWALGQKLVCPPDSADPNKDCLVDGTGISTQDVDWTVAYTTSPCPSGDGYESTCQAFNVTTTGKWSPLLSLETYDVFTANLYLSSQQVKVGENEVGPKKAKCDWIIQYPWAAFQNKINDQNAHLTTVSYIGGKSSHYSATVQSGDDGVGFSNNGVTTYAVFSSSSSVDTKDSTTHWISISGEDILNYKLGIDATSVIIAIYQVVFKIWKAFGWSFQVIFFSWNENKPVTVFYDPAFGQTEGSALGLAPGLMLPLFVCIAQYIFNKLIR